MSAYDTKETSAEHDRMPAFGKGLVTFGVSYHETFDFFWIKGPLRCKADNFFGYDLE
jgi:5-enolpyruvylshikimate-3-phosphate synthase